MDIPGLPALTLLILIPLGAALLVFGLPKHFQARHSLFNPRYFSLLACGLTAALGAAVIVRFEVGPSDFQFVSKHNWIESIGSQWFLGVDGISLLMVGLTVFLFPLAIFASRPPEGEEKTYYGSLLLLQAGCLGAFVALDLLLFFVFFEVVLVPMYFLIGRFGHERARFAATKFFIFTMSGSALMLVGILATALLTSSNSGETLTFDLVQLADSGSLSVGEARWVFLAFILGFGVKVPLFPAHTWLPDAHTEAPTAGSVILAGVLLKLGTYGFVRFGIYLFPEAADFFAPILMGLGVAGILYGAVVATMQKDLKRLVAYSSIAHLGFIVLGLFALNTQGLTGGTLQMLNHGLSTGALFFLVGYLYERRHTRQISELEGLQKVAPVFAGIFTVVMLSSIGLPGLNGFVGEFLILIGAFEAHRWWAVAATIGVILAAVYLLWAYKRVFHGPVEGSNAKVSDLKSREKFVLGLILIPIVVLGVYPRIATDRIEPTVEALEVRIEAQIAAAGGT